MIETPLEDVLGPLSERELRHAPARIWTSGDIGLLRETRRVAIVGSRRASGEGLRRAARLARELVAESVTVVSGLALGIDARAHGATLEARGRTIAVLPTPLDAISPRSNASLFAEIVREHLAISEFPSGHPVQGGNFPRRNRTMALICHASVIIEAGEGSGTLSQGWEAIRLGRPLFIARSVVEGSGLDWPERMLDHGARVLSSSDDVLEMLPSAPLLTTADLAF